MAEQRRVEPARVADDVARWDRRYAERGPLSTAEVALPARFQPFADVFPAAGHAVELACGRGAAAVWLARRGLTVWACDASEVAITQARDLAERCGQAARCRFEVADLDAGLPPGEQADVVLCNMFRDTRLDGPIVERLAPSGILAISALSEVGSRPGRFRARQGELSAAFEGLDVIAHGEQDGEAWLVARRR
ncbi:bifunctional 2-polyprenyl-6-hydroxyphenol methylase/3-demethylubiquinol 3-O-methyltransferase UbiG [Mycobacterium sp. NAZ190054]|uniref:class I SAM-dependent methyltransferase n=1 Tax=Mycobacterium sp. NAZ190054 TaxID=1747766 RepID=UPI000796C1FE|nr:class I SAM-dependent methyltransferase [Mycobacterium sp. NAZ190054]KWX67494.1 SAM-dependent methyltransferase [Mycobacterium sp. NAZ190054]